MVLASKKGSMRNKVFITVFAMVSLLLLVSAVFFDSAYTAMVTTAVAIFGGLAIYLQIHKESKIAEGEFIHNLDQSFKQGDTWEVATRLFSVEDELVEGRCATKEGFCEQDRAKIMAYLTFFETLYLLVEERVIKMSEVDQLFRRRFFKATMNKDIQNLELVKHYYGYTNIYLLDLMWRQYLSKKTKGRRSADQLATISKHGITLKQAHDEFWSQDENRAHWDMNEGASGDKLCGTYIEVVELGGRVLFDKQIQEVRSWTEPRRGGKDLLDDFLLLLSRIPERDPSVFFAFSEDQVREIFEKQTTSCCIFYDGRVPVAGGFIWTPEAQDSAMLSKEHEGIELGYAVGGYQQLDNTVVDPEHRGEGLQAKVVSCLLRGVQGKVVATVSPKNPVSRKNLCGCGFTEVKRVERHGGYERLVLLCESPPRACMG